MFTVAQRDALRERILEQATADDRVVAGAVVGSLADGTADRYSDVDLTFGIRDDVEVGEVLEDWTRRLVDDLDAVHLVDLERGPTIYRVFLLPDALQFDLSMTLAARFRPAGPRFRLVFGETAARNPSEPVSDVGDLFIATPTVAADIFGWGVIYALHARACIERGRVWQAEHYVGAVRDHALSLACLNQGVTVAQARGFDDLPWRSSLGSTTPMSVTSNPRRLGRRSLPPSARCSAKVREAGLPHARGRRRASRRASLTAPR